MITSWNFMSPSSTLEKTQYLLKRLGKIYVNPYDWHLQKNENLILVKFYFGKSKSNFNNHVMRNLDGWTQEVVNILA